MTQVVGVDPGKAAAFHRRRARKGAQDRDAEAGEGAGDGQLLAPADAGAHAADDGPALDHDERVARVALLQAIGRRAVDVVDVHATRGEGRHQRVVLGLHLGHIRHRVALEVPAGVEIAERADLLDPLRGVYHRHFRPRAVDEDRADRAHIVVDTPGATPVALQLGRILEGRIAGGGEHLDGLVVDPAGIGGIRHRLSFSGQEARTRAAELSQTRCTGWPGWGAISAASALERKTVTGFSRPSTPTR